MARKGLSKGISLMHKWQSLNFELRCLSSPTSETLETAWVNVNILKSKTLVEPWISSKFFRSTLEISEDFGSTSEIFGCPAVDLKSL